jgi:hypothetical protein
MKLLEKIVPLKTRKSRIIVGIIAFLIIALFCIILCYTLAANTIFHQPTGDEIFRELLLDPIPRSVIILQWQEADYCCGDWLHFKISPDDFNAILASKEWKIDPDSFYVMDAASSEVESWWKPQLLGDNTIEYSFVFKSLTDDQGDILHDEVEYILVNSQRDEIYLYYVNTYPH